MYKQNSYLGFFENKIWVTRIAEFVGRYNNNNNNSFKKVCMITFRNLERVLSPLPLETKICKQNPPKQRNDSKEAKLTKRANFIHIFIFLKNKKNSSIYGSRRVNSFNGPAWCLKITL